MSTGMTGSWRLAGVDETDLDNARLALRMATKLQRHAYLCRHGVVHCRLCGSVDA